MDIWFTLIGGALGRMILPGIVFIGGYVWFCKRHNKPVNGKIVYYICSVLFLISIFASIGDIWDSQSFTGAR